MKKDSNKKKIAIWIARLVPAILMLQTLFYKFTAHPEAVATFTALGWEPTGRILVGVMELIIGIALLLPIFPYAAFFSLGIGIGAVASHILVLGISGLFYGALAIIICSIFIIIVKRKQMKKLFSFFGIRV